MSWAARADALIAQIHAELSEGCDLATRRRALRAKAQWFHGGTSWGKKVWAARSRLYLSRHGAEPRKRTVPLFAADITFPFRSEVPQS